MANATLTFNPRSLSERLLGERSHSWTWNLGLVTLGSLVVGLLAKIEFLIPGTPVPVTGQTLGVLVAGATLGSKRGAAAIAMYLGLGASGLPWFSTLGQFAVTGGYLLAFLPAAFVVGLMAEARFDRKVSSAIPAFLAGHGVVFLGGWSWLALSLGAETAWTMGVLPFVPGMIVKTLLASMILPAAWKLTQPGK